MHALSLKNLKSSGLYQALLDQLVSKVKGEDGAGGDPLIPFITRLVEYRENESSIETERRWFREFSSLMDKVGAAKVMRALAECMEALQDRDLYGQVHQVIRDVCMRHETVRDGRRYDAHMMMVPLIFRGTNPSQFPSVIDSSVAGHLQIALQSAFQQALPHGEDALIIPGNVLYTLDEFRDERVDFFHNLLAQVAQVCRDTPNIDQPRWIKFPNEHDHGMRDSTLIDLAIPSLLSNPQNTSPGNPELDPVKKMPSGVWLTAKLFPVVVMWPREDADGQRTAPNLEDLGVAAGVLSQWISFCAPLDAVRLGDSLDFEVSAIGLFPPQKASLRARMMLTHETFMGNFLRSLPALDPNGLYVKFTYDVDTSLFSAQIHANNAHGGVQVYLPHSSTTQIFIENMAAEMKALGIRVEIDLGDGMLRYEGLINTPMQ